LNVIAFEGRLCVTGKFVVLGFMSFGLLFPSVKFCFLKLFFND